MGLSVQRVSARDVCPPPEVWGQRAKVHLPRGVSVLGRSAHTEASFGSALGGEAVSDPPRRRQHLGSSPRAVQGATHPGSPGSPRQDAQDSSPAGWADPTRVIHPSTSKLSTPATPETFLLSSRWAPPTPPTRPRPAPPGEDPRGAGLPTEPVGMRPPAGHTLCCVCVCARVCAHVCVCMRARACTCVCARVRVGGGPHPRQPRHRAPPGGGPQDVASLPAGLLHSRVPPH